MHSLNFIVHDCVVAISSVACLAGLLLLWERKENNNHEPEETEKTLFRMTFSYWLVYCLAFGIQKIVLPDWETVLLSLRITAALSYFLTFSCIVSLPLHKLAVRHVQQ
jgi:peptidoglycan biosynthesis protein MviN/MurJ (putative lipid II flippase)